MKDEFANLFYTPADKILFWVAGYTADNNTASPIEMAKSLIENAQKFADKVGCKVDEVKTLFNGHPPRYQFMRVFYVETENPHKEAFIWRPEQKMWDILRS